MGNAATQIVAYPRCDFVKKEDRFAVFGVQLSMYYCPNRSK